MAIKGTRERSSSGFILGSILFAVILIVYMYMSGIMDPVSAARNLFNAALSYLPAPVENIIGEVIGFAMSIIRRILREFQRLLRQLL